MNKRKWGWLALMTVLLALMTVPALAAEKTVTVVLSETDINSSYRVTNPVRRTLSEVYVDLQTGQVVITATYTAPNVSPIPVSVTLVPTLSNGRVTWAVSAATANGKPASADLLTQLNKSISSSWRSYWKSQNPGKVTAFSISADSLTWTKVTTR